MTVRAEEKFRMAFDAHFDAINRYCLRRVPLNDVNDVVAEVFTVAWRKVESLPDGDGALPWLYGVARHEVLNRRRSTRRFAALTRKLTGIGDLPNPEPEEVLVRNSDLKEVLEALESLRPGDRELLLLRTHEELDYSEMAVVMGCSPEAARKRLGRAIGRLRRAVDQPHRKGKNDAAIRTATEVTHEG